MLQRKTCSHDAKNRVVTSESSDRFFRGPRERLEIPFDPALSLCKTYGILVLVLPRAVGERIDFAEIAAGLALLGEPARKNWNVRLLTTGLGMTVVLTVAGLRQGRAVGSGQ